MKKFIYICFFMLFVANTSFADLLNKVKISGNDRISKETIIVFSKLNKIKKDVTNLSPNDLNNILKNLYSTNFFKEVEVKVENNFLKIKVAENPILQTITINGIKKNEIVEILRENTLLREKNSFIKSRVKNDEQKILNILKSNGYYFAEVTSKIKENNNNSVDLIFDVNLGDKAYIKKIKFIGDKKLKDRKLKSIIVSEETKFWKFLSRKRFLDIKRIKLDERLLANYYKNNGYYNISVESSSAKVIEEKNFELVFNINAGQKFYFNKLNLSVPEDYSKENFLEITSIMKDAEGKVYSLKKIENILKEIDKIALTKEFEFINSTYNENIIDNNKINLNINLVESKKSYVEKINIFGNFITEEKVIRNALLVDEGDAYNEILVNKSRSRIRSRNIFDTVTIKTSKASDPNNKILDIRVTEKPTGEISAGAGTGSSGSTLSFGLKENNYLGTGVKVNTVISFSNTGIKGNLTTKNPNYKNSDRALNTNLESSTKDVMSRYGYKSSRTGFSFGTSYEQFRDIYFSPSISNYYENIETSSSASAAKKKQEGDYFETLFTYSLVLNKYNQNFQPTDGYRSAFYQSIPLYSDGYNLSNTYEFTKYFPVNDNLIFSMAFLGKTVNSLNGEDVRVTKRVFLPSSRLRGFEVGKIGPLDGGDFIGGNYGTSLNFISTLPRLFPEMQNLDFNFFVDLANIWGVDYNSSLDSSKLRSSTGLAIDWFTPIGPLNFSLSQPITKASTDVTETFRFNIGTTF